MDNPANELIQEQIKLQKDFLDYVHKNGFDYGAYCASTPGSYYETYRKRLREIREQLAARMKTHH